MKHVRFLAAKTALVLALTIGGASMPAHAGIPVIDGGNLAQNIMTAIESVAQTLKQIEQYRTQLQQYENMLQNTAAPASYIWDQAQSTINGLMSATNTLDYYKQQLGSLDSYLGKFQDVNYYKSSPCFTSAGCSAAEWAAMKQAQQFGSESQKKANDALFKGLELQQRNLKGDAETLQRLQSSAQGATGQMQAIGYANQLASNQANQLLQIRGLLIAQQTAVTSKMQADADREAQERSGPPVLAGGVGDVVLGGMFSSFLHVGEFFFKARCSYLEVIGVDLCGEGSPPGVQGCNGCRAQTAEGFPNNVTGICARNDLALHQGQRLLIGMQITQIGADTLAAVNGRLLPDVCDAVGMSPLGPHLPPSFLGNGAVSVDGEIGALGLATVLVAVIGHANDGLRWREVPQVTLGQIFASRGIRHATSIVRFRHG